MITVPVYHIHCDECGSVSTFPLAATVYPNVYELRLPNEVYAHFGGEIAPDGKHRCATCCRKGSSEPNEITARVTRMQQARSVVQLAQNIVAKAGIYRATEQDGTPRLWRGKDLHEKAMALDEALEQLAIHRGYGALKGQFAIGAEFFEPLPADEITE